MYFLFDNTQGKNAASEKSKLRQEFIDFLKQKVQTP